MTTAQEIFGSNSDGGFRMSEWLEVMCQGCKNGRTFDGMAGYGCELPIKALLHEDIPEWSADAMWPERFRDVFNPDDPWPVCLAFEPRKKRSDAGLRRGPRPLNGQLELS